MAAILAARKLAQYDGGRRVPATVAAISDAVRWAEEIMQAIDMGDPANRQFRHDSEAVVNALKGDQHDDLRLRA
jgi:hypothetical protein